MNTNTQTNSSKTRAKHLPYYPALKDYDASDWVCFGGLTHKYPTSATTQLKRFKALMNSLGSLNGSYGRRLHWVVRVEKNLSGEEHLHFLLGGHKVTDGHRHQFTPEQACKFLELAWDYGTSEIRVHDVKKDGLGYVLKSEGNDEEDIVEISPALMTFLKRRKADPYHGRDPLSVEIIQNLRAKGVRAGFGFEMDALKKRAA